MALCVSVREGSSALCQLNVPWWRLVARSPGYYLSQTPAWAESAAATVALAHGRHLKTIAVHRERRLAAVWPLVTYQKLGLTIVRPLGSESTEYSSPLVEPGLDGDALVGRLWAEATKMGDVVLLPYVQENSCLTTTLAASRVGTFTRELIGAPYLLRNSYPDWDSYLESVSVSHLATLRRKRRRLAERGPLDFKKECPRAAAALLDWVLDNKKRWLRQRQLPNPSIGRADYRAFLHAMLRRPGGLSLFTLNVKGVPVAAQVSAVTAQRVEFLIGVHDANWGRFSPGDLVMHDCLRWAYEHGLDYDFRIGDEPYKSVWARQRTQISTWRIAASWRGRCAIGWLKARSLMRRTG